MVSASDQADGRARRAGQYGEKPGWLANTSLYMKETLCERVVLAVDEKHDLGGVENLVQK